MLPTEPTYNRTLFRALAWRARSLSQKTLPTVSVFPLTGCCSSTTANGETLLRGVEWEHWLCSQNPALSPHKTPTRYGARGEEL